MKWMQIFLLVYVVSAATKSAWEPNEKTGKPDPAYVNVFTIILGLVPILGVLYLAGAFDTIVDPFWE